MKKNIVCLCLFFSCQLFAEPYRFEGLAFIGESDQEDAVVIAESLISPGLFDSLIVDDISSSLWGVGGTYYFRPVSIEKGPLAEAAFLSKSSSFFLGYAEESIDKEFNNTNPNIPIEFSRFKVEEDTSFLVVGGEYIAFSKLILGASYSEVKEEYIDTDNFTFTGGIYINDYSSVKLAYRFIDSDFIEVDEFTLSYKHLFELLDRHYFRLEAGLGATDADNDVSGEIYTLEGGCYFGESFSASLGGAYRPNDVRDISRLSFGLQYFFTRSFSVSLDYESIDRDDLGNIEETLISIRKRI